MITTAKEYFQHLYEVQNKNLTDLAVLLPSDEKIYDINWDTRIIEAPKFLGVNRDHVAETIYFKCDRFFDNQDLASEGMACAIQYINANGDSRIYRVPFLDITTYRTENKIIFPWIIGHEVTKVPGNVSFAIQFFKTEAIYGEEKEIIGSKFLYNLLSLITLSRVLKGIDASEDENYDYPASELEGIYSRLMLLEGQYKLKWTYLDTDN